MKRICLRCAGKQGVGRYSIGGLKARYFIKEECTVNIILYVGLEHYDKLTS